MKPHQPSVECLAQLAAILSTGAQLSPTEAVERACEIWHVAREKLSDKSRALIMNWVRAMAPQTQIRQLSAPRAFPATFEEFLKIVVRAKTPADATKRFRDFLKDRVAESYEASAHSPAPTSIEMDNEALNLLEQLRRGGFSKNEFWDFLSRDYRAWWSERRSKQWSLAGQKSAEKRAAKAGTKGQAKVDRPSRNGLTVKR
ncbi:MAG: hypothetical protein FJ387_24870 [Verrucomicrobia bacterium]|nr:hypothetical protein [Verrucomicrobiota bacterium]